MVETACQIQPKLLTHRLISCAQGCCFKLLHLRMVSLQMLMDRRGSLLGQPAACSLHRATGDLLKLKTKAHLCPHQLPLHHQPTTHVPVTLAFCCSPNKQCIFPTQDTCICSSLHLESSFHTWFPLSLQGGSLLKRHHLQEAFSGNSLSSTLSQSLPPFPPLLFWVWHLCYICTGSLVSCSLVSFPSLWTGAFWEQGTQCHTVLVPVVLKTMPTSERVTQEGAEDWK